MQFRTIHSIIRNQFMLNLVVWCGHGIPSFQVKVVCWVLTRVSYCRNVSVERTWLLTEEHAAISTSYLNTDNRKWIGYLVIAVPSFWSVFRTYHLQLLNVKLISFVLMPSPQADQIYETAISIRKQNNLFLWKVCIFLLVDIIKNSSAL